MLKILLLFLTLFFSLTGVLSAQLPNILLKTGSIDIPNIASPSPLHGSPTSIVVANDGTIFLVDELGSLNAITYNGGAFTILAQQTLQANAKGGSAITADGTIILTSALGLDAYAYDATNQFFSALGGIATNGSPALDVAIAADGTIMLANGTNGLRAYTYSNSFSNRKNIYTGKPATGIAIASDGTIFLANGSGGLGAYTYDAAIPEFADQANINDGGTANDVAIAADGTIFLASSQDGLRAYTYDGTTFTNTAHFSGTSTFESMAIAADNTILVAMGSDGLAAYTYDGTDFTKIAHAIHPGVAYDIAFAADGSILLANGPGGLLSYKISVLVDHFSISTIPASQSAGTAFNVTIAAVDANGDTLTDYIEKLAISAAVGTVSPAETDAFVAGVLTQTITPETAASGQVLTFTDGIATGMSNSFDVAPAAADTFIVTATDDSPLGNQVVNAGFNIKVVALDAFGNEATGFTDTATLSDLTGTITPTTTDNFVAGVLASQSVTITDAQTADSITVTAGSATGSSSSFDVTVGTSVADGTGLHAPVTDYVLNQNYPNPFNPTTNISYALVQAGTVKLSVFDTRGRLVQELVNTAQQAGRYTVNFDAGNVPSGIYFYKLQAGSFSSMKKMILIR